jgi:hypothetical protein
VARAEEQTIDNILELVALCTVKCVCVSLSEKKRRETRIQEGSGHGEVATK